MYISILHTCFCIMEKVPYYGKIFLLILDGTSYQPLAGVKPRFY